MLIKTLGRVDYAATLDAMRAFTETRGPETPDELWLCEFDPVYTQGLAGQADNVLDPQGIPVVQTNRGGQVTYHGPGQVVAYPLVDLKRLGIFVKEYVFRLEPGVNQPREGWGVPAPGVGGAPGIFGGVEERGAHAALTGPADPSDPFRGLGKVAALGIKISRHCTYHGVALNVAMDLKPFLGIHPCGYAGLQTVDLGTLGVFTDWATVAQRFGERLAAQLQP